MAAAVSLFASINAALLTPLPYPRAQDLYTVRTYFTSGRFTSGLIARAELLALAGMSDAVEGASGAIRTDAVLTSGSDAREVVGYSVSSGFFEVFGVPPALGRAFGPPDYVQGAPTQVVLSDRLWKNVFGSDPSVVGRVVSLGGANARVIGVARPGFDVPAGADLWMNVYVPDTSIGHSFEGFVRLRPTATVASLKDRMASAMAALGRRYPDQDDGRAYELRPLLDDTVGDLKSILIILFLATGLLLVLAIVNVTNLMLARLASRRHEFALRAALGATRWQLVSIVLGESLAVGVAAGILGLGASWGIVHLLPALGIARLPRLDALNIGRAAVAFAGIMSVLVGLLVAAGPALRSGRMDLAAVMNEVGRGVRTSRRTRRLLSAFVAAEIAVAIALIAGAGRLTRSYTNLQRVDPGFQADGRLVIDVMLPFERYRGTKTTTVWWDTARDRLRAIGATHVAGASSLPLVPHEWDSTTFVDLSSFPNIPPENRPNARWRRITPGFFQTMGIPLLTGRDFDATDSPDSPFVAIVNQAFVRRFLGDRDPLREKLVKFAFRMVGPNKFVVEDAAVVGVAADVK
ncbi:MAG TPA: ABC transporter permease, partial [Vicinamibacterales bacterium]|nr:ABC transporter permease [Vicinamibacterales bacterium]